MNPVEEWRLETRRLGRRVLVYDCVDSTNSRAAAWAMDPRHDGLAFLAGQQTAGRGRQGRSWHCPPGSGVLLSLLLFPPPTLRRPALLTAWATVSVCKTIQAGTGLEPRIKWPNDILVEGRKVCGILIEQGKATVVGIGLNLNQTTDDFLASGLPEAASLFQVTGRKFDCRRVAGELIRFLDEEYDPLLRGELAHLEKSWRDLIGLNGKGIHAGCRDGVIQGRLHQLSLEALVIEDQEGKMIQVPPEKVQHLQKS